MKIILSILLMALAVACFAQDAAPSNIYAGGISWNQNASPQIAGTGLYARKVSDSTYAFTSVDVLPTTLKPFSVTTQFGAGVAQKVLTINNVRIYVPTSAGVSYNGSNTGWAWSTGGMAVLTVKGNWRAMPNVRVVKSSVSNNTGYQLIVGALFGWGQ